MTTKEQKMKSVDGIFVITRNGAELWEKREDGKFSVYLLTPDHKKKRFFLDINENLKPDRIEEEDSLTWEPCWELPEEVK